VTTNAAGRAAVRNLTATGHGAFRITASATFQGQTAVATIAQTNVATAAEAAQISSASGAGGLGSGAAGGVAAAGGAAAAGGVAAGGATAGGAAASGAAAGGAAATGGGLSALTVGIVGGAVAGGAFATKEVLGIFSFDTYKGPFRIEAVETSNSDPNQALCTSTLATVGTLTLDLQEQGDGSVKGELQSEWNTTEIARTCRNPKGPIPGDHRGSDVTGTTGNLQVVDGFGSFTLSFAGALSGSVINGTWTMGYTYTCLPPGPNGQAYCAGTPATGAPVTLQKQ
jgi:hypothetical protein